MNSNWLIIPGLTALCLAGCGESRTAVPVDNSTPATRVDENSSEQVEPPLINSIGIKLVRIPAGEFLMGSAETDDGARDDETPQHRVKISRSFYMGVYEVSQRQFAGLMETNPSSFSRAGLLQDAPQDLDCLDLPVDNVTWFAAIEFCRRLSNLPAEKEAGRVYRLPTEAEWEYACRAGTESIFYFGNSLSSSQANFNGIHPFGNAETGPFLNRTATVGSYKPNAFGLYDMHGNLHEWCMDRFDRDYYRDSPGLDPQGSETGTYRVIRGGDWYSDGRDCRSAFRYADVPEGKFYALGMRVVCELTSEGAKPGPIITAPGEPPEAVALKLEDKPMPTSGEDWPRWRGVRGDGTWHGPKLSLDWPQEGLRPARVWSRPIGGGYGGIAVSDGRVFVMHRRPNPGVEGILCFDAVSGEPLWTHEYETDYSEVSYDNGPRSTPTVFGGRVYTLGAVGHVFCLDEKDGTVLWSKDLVEDLGARVPIWGLSASPLIVDESVILHAGVEPGGCFIAFDLVSGEERWRSLSDAAGYATPILVRQNESRQLVGWTPTNVRGLDPRTGTVLWTVPFEVNYGTSIAHPIFAENLVLISSYYEGTQAIRLGDDPGRVEIAWHERLNLRGLMSQPLYRDRHAYLIDKRHGLTCFELASGKKIWDDDNRMTPKGRNPQATMVWLNDEDLAIVLSSDGDLILVRLNPGGYVEETRANIIGRTWAHPAYAGNCVYARNDTEIICVLLPRETTQPDESRTHPGDSTNEQVP